MCSETHQGEHVSHVNVIHVYLPPSLPTWEKSCYLYCYMYVLHKIKHTGLSTKDENQKYYQPIMLTITLLNITN